METCVTTHPSERRYVTIVGRSLLRALETIALCPSDRNCHRTKFGTSRGSGARRRGRARGDMRSLVTRRSGILLGLTIALCLMPSGHEVEHDVRKRLADLFHIPLFGGLALALIALAVRDGRTIRAVLLPTLGGTALLAIVIEVVQPLTGRSASLEDALNGLAGILLAGLAALLHERRAGLLPWMTALSLTILAFVAAGLPLVRAVSLHRARTHALPRIASFEEPWEAHFFEPSEPNKSELALVPAPGRSGTALRFAAIPGAYRGVAYRAQGLSLEGWSSLVFAVYLEGASEGGINVRIDDDEDCREHDNRFNKTIPVKPGWNEVRIEVDEVRAGPQNRTLNVTAIDRIVFFLTPDDDAPGLILDDIRLEGRAGAA